MNVAIVGAGKLGLKVISALLGGDHSITVIDKDEEILSKISQQMDVLTVNGNGKSISWLKELGNGNVDLLLASTDRDEKNIVIASFAKKLGCTKVIARVRDPEHMNQMDFIKDTMNIDYLVNPDLAITMEIYKYLVEKYTLNDGIFTSGKTALVQFHVKKMKQLIGLSMVNVKKVLPTMLIVAISRKIGTFETKSSYDSKIELVEHFFSHCGYTVGADDTISVVSEYDCDGRDFRLICNPMGEFQDELYAIYWDISFVSFDDTLVYESILSISA